MKSHLSCAALALLWCSSAAPRALAQPEAAPETPLAELLAHAEQHGPRLELARRQRDRADAAREGASAWLHDDPTLTLAAGPRFAGSARALDLQASLAQPLEVAGERGLRRRLATRVAEHADAELESVRALLSLEVRQAYQTAREARARLELAERLARVAERTLEVARRRLLAGDTTRVDQLVAESGAARAEGRVLEARRALDEARTELAALVGWPLARPPQVSSGLEPTAAPPDLARLLSRTLGAHPELRARRAALAEARARLELAERQALPTPTLGLSFAREGSVGSPANTILLGSLALPLPLWAGNREARAQERAEAAVAREEAGLAARLLEAHVRRAHAALSAAAARAALLEEGVSKRLDASLALLERGFEHGELSALELTAAEEQIGAAELDALAARADYHRARAELEYLSGEALGPEGAAPNERPRAGAER